jgi:predicted anti-sigma-YlaC factor YlaD
LAIGYYVRCDEIVELVSDYLEKTLEPIDAEALEQHVVLCAACATYLEQMRAVLESSSALSSSQLLDEASFAPLLALFRERAPGAGKDEP